MEWLNSIEQALVDIVATVAPWLAPVPTAYLVGRATVRYLAWPVLVAWVAAVVIEALGLASTSTALTLWDYNRSKRKSDPKAPLALATVLVGVYFVVATGLTVALDVVPEMALWAPVIFPTLSLTGVSLLALRADHRRRLAAIAADKEERRARRSSKRSSRRSSKRSVDGQVTGQVNAGGRSGERPVDGQVTGQVNVGERSSDRSVDGQLTGQVNVQGGQLDHANRARRVSKEDATRALVAFFKNQPGGSYREAGESVGRSKSWVSGMVNELEEAGVLRRNGNGVEVIGRLDDG